jgi:L-threonylcarbamoyladenylate synthase
MSVVSGSFDETIVRLLLEGGIGVLRTDTLYGIVAKADSQQAVERIYTAKTRTPTKSPIVLIASVDQLFDSYSNAILEKLRDIWPAKTSIILRSSHAPVWLTRGNESVAYRLPDNEELRRLLRLTGPLIAPSANPEGQSPAMDIVGAQDYFGDKVDFYVDHGIVTDDTPSALYRLEGDALERLR